MSSSSCTSLDFKGSVNKTVEEVLDKADGVHLVIKDADSKILWCNQNFADLVGQTKSEVIGSVDPRKEHVDHDKAVLKSGIPLLNLHESIVDGKHQDVPIVTQKGIVRHGQENIGITVCFSLDDEKGGDYWTKRLSLRPNPLGGLWAPGLARLSGPDAPPIYSTNYYMLTGTSVLGLHKLAQDESWFFHAGHAIRIHMFGPILADTMATPKYESVLIGGDQGLLQYAVPAGVWFGADLPDLGFSLSSCSLTPGYTPSSSANPDKEALESLRSAFKSQPDVLQILNRLVQ